jgi:hypothetical protein
MVEASALTKYYVRMGTFGFVTKTIRGGKSSSRVIRHERSELVLLFKKGFIRTVLVFLKNDAFIEYCTDFI